MHARAGLTLAALAALAGLGGCVERELQVNSEPQGALVYMNDQELGRTPLTRDFTWYGTYDVAVRKEGYETLKTATPVIAPWWQWMPFDFVAEILPMRLRDTHRLSYSLRPVSEAAADPDRLVRRGENMRDQLESGEKPAKATGPTSRPSKAPRNRPARTATAPAR